jgi:hypothetical protein
VTLLVITAVDGAPLSENCTSAFCTAIAETPSTRCEVWCFAEDPTLLRLTGSDQIANDDYPRSNSEADGESARGKSKRPDPLYYRQRRPDRPFGIIFMGLRITEIDQHAVAPELRDEPIKSSNFRRNSGMVTAIPTSIRFDLLMSMSSPAGT